MKYQVITADLADVDHQQAIVFLLDAYSQDPMGDAQPLSDFARENLIDGLQRHPTTTIFLAWGEEEPVGIATCFRGFSTFAAMPLLSISDYYVRPSWRGRGVGRSLLAAVERAARDTGCCKLTLEVQQNNARARSIYSRFGFARAAYPADADGGGSLAMVKSLHEPERGRA